jgi:hypothetical protein
MDCHLIDSQAALRMCNVHQELQCSVLKSEASPTRDSQEGREVGIPLRTHLSTNNLPRVQITRSMQQNLTAQCHIRP